MIITCAGDCGTDNYIDHKIIKPGGIILNFAVHIRQAFGPRDSIEIIAPIGNDKAGELVKAEVKKSGIVSHLIELPGKTPVQYIDHDKRGEKIFTKYEEGVLKDFRISDKEKQLIERSDFVITVIYDQILTFFQSVIEVKPKGIMAVDFMDLADSGRKADIVEKYIDYFDIAFFGLRAHQTTLLKDLKNLASMHNKLFVITLGPIGSLAYDITGEYFEPAVKVERVVDTTGAGDAFAAKFTKEYLTTKDIQRSLAAGNKKAAEIIQQVGSF